MVQSFWIWRVRNFCHMTHIRFLSSFGLRAEISDGLSHFEPNWNSSKKWEGDQVKTRKKKQKQEKRNKNKKKETKNKKKETKIRKKKQT